MKALRNIETGQEIELVEGKYEIVDAGSQHWNPGHGDIYYFFDDSLKVGQDGWMDEQVDRDGRESGNCFKTREEAEMQAIRIRLNMIPNTAKAGAQPFYAICSELNVLRIDCSPYSAGDSSYLCFATKEEWDQPFTYTLKQKQETKPLKEVYPMMLEYFYNTEAK